MKKIGVWVIGSAEDCDVVLAKPVVSGRHCRLTLTDKGFFLEDLASTNKTFVNDELVVAGRIVTPADKITLGRRVCMPWPKVKNHPMRVFTIGRDPHNDITRDLPQVSGCHCQIILTEKGETFLGDFGATNGTSIGTIENKICHSRIEPDQPLFLGSYETTARQLLAAHVTEWTAADSANIATPVEPPPVVALAPIPASAQKLTPAPAVTKSGDKFAPAVPPRPTPAPNVRPADEVQKATPLPAIGDDLSAIQPAPRSSKTWMIAAAASVAVVLIGYGVYLFLQRLPTAKKGPGDKTSVATVANDSDIELWTGRPTRSTEVADPDSIVPFIVAQELTISDAIRKTFRSIVVKISDDESPIGLGWLVDKKSFVTASDLLSSHTFDSAKWTVRIANKSIRILSLTRDGLIARGVLAEPLSEDPGSISEETGEHPRLAAAGFGSLQSDTPDLIALMSKRLPAEPAKPIYQFDPSTQAPAKGSPVLNRAGKVIGTVVPYQNGYAVQAISK